MKKIKKRKSQTTICRSCGHNRFNITNVNVRRVTCAKCGKEIYI